MSCRRQHAAPPHLLAARDLRIVTQPLDERGSFDELIAAVSAGAVALVVPVPGDEAQARLTGVRVTADLPVTEWFVTLAGRPEAARLDGEVPVTAPLRTLGLVEPGVTVAATTSVRFEHHPTLTVRPVGRGVVVASGVADVVALLDHPTLGRYVRRLLGAPVPSVERLGLAVVGYGPFGGMGYAHGLAATETEGLAFVAAVDPVGARRTAAEQDFPGVRTYESVASLVDDDTVDVAVVATPPARHADLAVALLEAGKHVVVEKPMCLTVADADRIMAAADEHDRVVTVHQSRRWDPDVLTLHHAVEAGLVGEVFNVETFVGGFEHPCRAWHSDEVLSGGAVFDWGSHHVDWILHLLGGPPERLLATSHKRVWHDVSNADQITVWMQWADGREATFRQSDVAAIRRPKFYVQGTAGTIEGHYRPVRFEELARGRGYRSSVTHHAEAPVELRVVRRDDRLGLVEQHLAPTAPGRWEFHRNLADHLLLGEPLAVPPEESREVVAVLEAAHRAAVHGVGLVRLP